MPFDEEDPKEFVPKIGVKKVGQSMFDDQPRKQTQKEFQQKVQSSQEKLSGYKAQAAELNSQFYKAMSDKTLAQNKSPFQLEIEHELLTRMISLANDINNDEVEGESIGTLTILVPLMKTCFAQRNKINELEYALFQLQKKTEPAFLSDLIKKEISKTLDKKNNGE